MKAKRSKQYRKLMRQYCRIWNFREPYQVLVDAEIVKDASRFKMDLVPALERTVQGKVKPMITQCSMRHLYSQSSQPGMDEVIEFAKKTLERRRCGHHPDETDALSTLECLSSFVVDTGKASNNRYVVASQDDSVRRHMRGVRGVPLIYIARSVMIMEPMADVSASVVNNQERAKFRSELRSLAPAAAGSKRKRDDDESDDSGAESNGDEDAGNIARGHKPVGTEEERPKKKKKNYGPKGPNPLAAKKKKKNPASEQQQAKKPPKANDEAQSAAASEPAEKKKRKRRHKKPASGEVQSEGATQVATADVTAQD